MRRTKSQGASQNLEAPPSSSAVESTTTLPHNILLVPLFILFGFSIACSKGALPQAGEQLPTVTLKNIQGVELSSGSLATPFAALFFDPECRPCKRTVNVIKDYHKSNPDNTFVIITRQPERCPLSLLARFPVFSIESKDWDETLDIPGTPTLLLVGRDRRLVQSIVGRRSEAYLRKQLQTFFSREIS